ncbi:putative Endonuclease/exonuclease/phosphatase superfamily [Helianthus debilis subsp. tardiflorus]
MGGMKYTFLSGDGTNLSKLDRVLVCENFMNKWPNASLLALGRNISDHSPLILTTINNSFGPSPFRMFNSWFDLEGFDETVRKGLDSICESRFMDEVLATKFKVVKEELKNGVKIKKRKRRKICWKPIIS